MDHDQQPEEEYLRTYQVAEALGGVNPKTVTRWAREGKLPVLLTLGGHRRYPARAIRDLAAQLGFTPQPDDTANLETPIDDPAGGGLPSEPGEALPFGPAL